MQLSFRLRWVCGLALTALLCALPARAQNTPAAPGLPLSGRVVSPDGKPLPHVPVYVFVKSAVTVTNAVNHVPGSTIQENGQSVVTDPNGVYNAQGIRPGDTVSIFVDKAGYRYISGGDVSAGYGGYKASDLVVSPPTSILAGKVVDSSGTPVPAATVVAPASNIDLSATTDPTGEFVLEGLPAGDTEVFAVARSGYGRVRVQTGQSGLIITLGQVNAPATSDPVRGASILNALWRDTAGSSYAAHDSIPFELAPYDLGAALALAGKDGPPSDAILLGLVTASTLGDTAAVAPVVDAILARMIDPGQRALAAAAFGITLATAHPDLARPLLGKAKDWARQSPIEHLGGGERIAVAALAARVKDRDAEKMIDDTIGDMTDGARKANKNNPQAAADVVEQFLDNYAIVIAPAGSTFIERVVSHIPATDPSERKRLPRVLPTLRAAAVLAKYDATDASGLIRRMLAQGANAGMPVYGQAVSAVVEQLAMSDPDAALALARTVIDQDHKPIALAYAASGLKKDQAAMVWRDALADALTCRERSALSGWVASMAAQHDPPLGDMLFASAFKSLTKQVGLPGGMSAFMFYYSQFDPGQARAVFEKDYVAGQLAMRATDNDAGFTPPTLAMSSIDVDRALEMAAGIHGPSSAPAIRKIAQYVMLPPAQKHTLRFDRWMEPDAWLPGTPAEH